MLCPIREGECTEKECMYWLFSGKVDKDGKPCYKCTYTDLFLKGMKK